ncbi:MAG: class I SAM-dependent methyltransferase [Acidaminococcaceae bacterium]|nr:class I SAM-dependent methyltransferase [Acidaminococcaceae bacterium]
MWNEGYFTEGTYTYGYYRELSPAWQRLCLLANGYEIPEPGPGSVHCELGFGQGVSINIHAAAIQGRYFGTDFNPSHALHANMLCYASGTKADLRDISFAEMLEIKDVPQFDSISMHGVWTWISQDNQKRIVEFVRRYLKPGGVFYNSYNCFPGWAQNHPIRELLTMPDVYARSGNNAAERITNALAFAEKAVRANTQYAERHKSLVSHLQVLKKQDPSYLAHEYLNRDWNVMYFTEVAEMLKEAKLDYACTASLLDALDNLECMNMPEKALEFLTGIRHPLLREEMRDYYINRQFREDLYVKGGLKLTSQKLLDSLLETKYVIVVPEAEKLECIGYYRTVDFKSELITPIYNWLKADRSRPRNFTAFAGIHPEIAPVVLSSLLLVMAEQNIIAPCQSEEAVLAVTPYCCRLNRYLCRRALYSEDISVLASPLTGYGFNIGRIQQLFLHFLWEGKKESVLHKEVWNILKSQSRNLIKDGKMLETEKENLAELKEQSKAFLEKTLPVLKTLRIVSA